MAQNVVLNGVSYSIPDPGDTAWGEDLSDYLVAIATGFLQKQGGSFTLTAEVDFGATFGLKSVYFKSRTSTPATAGQVRLARADLIQWRNEANDGNVTLGVNASDELVFNGTSIQPSGDYITELTGDVIASGPGSAAATIPDGTIDNARVSPSAAIAYSKLALTGSIVDADISASAAIAMDKLASLDASMAAQTNGSGVLVSSAVTSLELSRLAGVLSSVRGISDTATFTNKSMSGASNTFTNIPAATAITGQLPIANGGTGQATAQAAIDALLPTQTGNSGEFLTTDGTNASWAAAPSSPLQSQALNNLGLNVSVASNIITIALKQSDGSTDPAAGAAAVAAGFRGATAANGNFDVVSQTAALSMTLGTAASLGVLTAIPNTVYVYLFNDAGTLTLGASLLALDEGTLQSSSTTATSNAVVYQASALTSKPIRLIGRFKATWTTAVGWSAITEVSVKPFPAANNLYVEATTAAGQAIGTSSTDVIFGTRVRDTHGAFNLPTGTFTAPFSATYTFTVGLRSAAVLIATNGAILANLVTSAGTKAVSYVVGSGGTEPRGFGGVVTVYLTAGQTAKVVGASSQATTLNTNADQNSISITSQAGA